MTTNIVEVACPNCNNPEADFMGIIVIEKTETNFYKCLKCRRQFIKKRTDQNLHSDFMESD